MPLEMIESDELAILRAHKAEHEEWAKTWAAKISTADAFCRAADEQRRTAQARAAKLERTLERLSKEAPIGDYVADLYAELSNALLIEELDQRRCLAIEALKG